MSEDRTMSDTCRGEETRYGDDHAWEGYDETELLADEGSGEPIDEESDEYEEITSEEVDQVVAVLKELIESVHSENIRMYLEDAAVAIHYLVYEDEDEDEDVRDDPMGEAA